MKYTVFIAGIVASGVALTALSAVAQGHKGQRFDFSQMDTNGDGEITVEEMDANRAARFATVDTDGDGKLSPEELLAADATRAEDRINRMMSRLDADGDGALSAEEMANGRHSERRARMFDRLDADNSGGLSQTELEQAREHAKERKKQRKGAID